VAPFGFKGSANKNSLRLEQGAFDGYAAEMDDDIRAITRRLATDEKTIGVQLELLDGLDPNRRTLVVDRLRVIDRFLGSGRTATDARSAANDLGVGVRNLYRLIARMEEVGPVAGLIPGYRAPKNVTADDEAENETIDAWLTKFLQTASAPSRARAEAYLQGRVDAYNEFHPDGPVMELPGPVAIAARVDALKRAGASVAGVVIGESILVDQVVLSPTVKGLRPQSVAATFVLDRATSTILGVGFSALPDEHGDGLDSALHDLSKRALYLAAAGLQFSPIRDLEWIVPPGLVEVADSAVDAAKRLTAQGPKPRLSVVEEGDRRHAVRIVAILGNGLGRLRFLTRAALDPDRREDASLSGSPEDGIEKIESVHEALLKAAARWNEGRIQILDPIRFANLEPGAQDLIKTLRSVFEPVLAALKERLPHGPEW
jgi:hypothetical protein